MVASTSVLSTGTIFKLTVLMTSSNAGEFAGWNEMKTQIDFGNNGREINSDLKKAEGVSR